MSGSLRIFISSTMEDLAPERAEIRRLLLDYNMAPVLAEDVPPAGGDSWTTIREEMKTCPVFVLILGERYGWIPTSGPESGRGLSVTELEFRHAQQTGMLILPFVKVVDGPEDLARGGFRSRVEDWDNGYFRQSFRTSRELVEKVGEAIIEVLTQAYLKQRLIGALAVSTPVPRRAYSRYTLPQSLVEAVSAGDAIVFVGSGLSLAAGLPSAAAFTDAVLGRLHTADPAYVLPAVSSAPFYTAPTDLELLAGADVLMSLAQHLVDPRLGQEPTAGHEVATRLFDLILTTNYDTLLEQSAPDRAVVWSDDTLVNLSSPAIVKLAGTITHPDTLVLTEFSLANLERFMARCRAAVAAQLAERPLVVVGTSLRDPAVVALMERVETRPQGWAIAPSWTTASMRRLARWNLTPLDYDGQDFFASLDAAIGTPHAR